jgi:hypothetical protein
MNKCLFNILFFIFIFFSLRVNAQILPPPPPATPVPVDGGGSLLFAACAFYAARTMKKRKN